MKTSLWLVLTLMTLMVMACTNNCTMIGYEDDFYKVLPNGRVEFKQEGAVLVGESDGVSYIKAAGSINGLACGCDGKGGSCTQTEDTLGRFCKSNCKGSCWGKIIKIPDKVVLRELSEMAVN